MKFETKKYKDGQITSVVNEVGDLHVKIRGNTYEDLFKAASTIEAWKANYKNKYHKSTLTIYCLIAQRSDRRFYKGESFDLKVVSNFINSLKYDCVQILHPHSSISLALIDNCEAISHFNYVEEVYNSLNNPILISPDAGAYKTTHEIAEKLNASLIPSNKVRVNGEPIIEIQGNVLNKDCLIVDDLADGGRTFKYLADSLKTQGAKKVFLYVTHGQFNHGFEELMESIDHIYCTNSFRDIDDKFVTQFDVI